MSDAEVLRFVEDMKKDPDLLAKVREGAGGLDSIVALAKEHGYEFTVQEAKGYMQGQSRVDLSDEQMEALAGGKGQAPTSTQLSMQMAGEVSAVTTTIDVAQASVATNGPAVVVVVE